MKKVPFFLFICLCLLSGISYGQGQSTQLVVRAQANDAKFIGSSMGGAVVVIRNAETGEVLAEGKTSGGTGDTERIMSAPRSRNMELSTPDAAKFETTLPLTEPVFVRVEASAPTEPHATASTELWVIPGKDITGDGIILKIPGFVVNIEEPTAAVTSLNEGVAIRANVVLMCGCPTSPGGMWNSEEYEIQAVVKKDGMTTATLPLSFAGETSTFEGTFTPSENGSYDITVSAYHPETGNTGVTRKTFFVSD